MATRHQTYEMPFGWVTIDTRTESAPEGYVSGPYDVTNAEAFDIANAASIELNEDGTGVIVAPDEP